MTKRKTAPHCNLPRPQPRRARPKANLGVSVRPRGGPLVLPVGSGDGSAKFRRKNSTGPKWELICLEELRSVEIFSLNCLGSIPNENGRLMEDLAPIFWPHIEPSNVLGHLACEQWRWFNHVYLTLLTLLNIIQNVFWNVYIIYFYSDTNIINHLWGQKKAVLIYAAVQHLTSKQDPNFEFGCHLWTKSRRKVRVRKSWV